MLSKYLLQTQQLLQNPPAPNSLYATSDLTGWINTARGQLAGESESVRVIGTLALEQGTQVYDFGAINLASASGVEGVINCRTIWIQAGTGQLWIRPRPFEWFSLYELNNSNPVQAQPKVWAQYGQGVNGSIYVSQVPDQAYTMNIDTVCYPEPLVTDATVEAIPYLWTDAVPYFAAYLALLSAQSAARQADANRMFERYTEFVNRARRFSNPSVLPGQYAQAPNVVRANQLGMQNQGQGGG